MSVATDKKYIKRKAIVETMNNELKNFQKTILKNVEFFMDENTDDFYAKYKVNGHHEVHKVTSPMFIAYLDSTLRSTSKKFETADWSEAIKVKKQNCLLNDNPCRIYKRLAGDEKSVWYFFNLIAN